MIPTAGVGLKASHIAEALASPAAGLFFEVHAENYMVAGGPRLAMLDAAREAQPLSLHGVGLSLAGHGLPDPDHLRALKALADRFEPFLLSEHLAWTQLDGRALPDLLPFPRTGEALRIITRNIDHAQSLLGRPLLIENPSHYMAIAGHAWSEQEFLAELARRTGCGLLLDLNNVHVSATNLGFDAADYLARFPAWAVGEIHLAGAIADAELDLLIDNHGARVPLLKEQQIGADGCVGLEYAVGQANNSVEIALFEQMLLEPGLHAFAKQGAIGQHHGSYTAIA